ncbi:CaiB/BaiF CoA-transferase family protein [Phytohabitans sp. ZYX-F-186]|uniref:CaiB/BaiF CoA-transferase family protein n=1 Tax=Phytohabitans maris TaxID=3071409 RepID=A0ABU0ZM25_9ACTN|nr:CaiB/BaiF CoA-transferase family protein [Phytohabitans sp. ZYX-F-186]MDQ7908033.1 CaiB/BaiF CoA-transferase family protein [Phytohabitans sp. ZYX-F-186]
MSTGAALAGVRVLDLSRQAPGPYCSMLLADFGADVILVEPPGGSTRGAETNVYWELERDPEVSRMAGLRRNKRSVVLDLKSDVDRAVMHRLVAGADVLLEGFRPGVAARLGIDWPRCRELNPRLVYCSLTGAGQDGPGALAAGHDINYLAQTGVLELIADQDGRPVIPLNLLADFAGGGLMAAYAIMVALFHRDRSGAGQHIDLAMVDGTLSLLTHAASLHFARGADLRAGHFFLSGQLPQYGVYRCADGRWVALGALEPWFYDELMRLTGRPDLAGSHRDPQAARAVADHLVGWFGARGSAEAVVLLDGADVCATRVATFAEAMRLAEERGMIARLDPDAPMVGVPAKLSATPGRVWRRPPDVGEHTDEIRAEVFEG